MDEDSPDDPPPAPPPNGGHAPAALVLNGGLPLPTPGGGDSGVESEIEQESISSDSSNEAVGGALPALPPLPPPVLPAIPAPAQEVDQGPSAADHHQQESLPMEEPPSSPLSHETGDGVGVGMLASSFLAPVASSSLSSNVINNSFPILNPTTTAATAAATVLQQPFISSGGVSSASSVSAVVPPPSVTEDGYLGDCSSDGGNEKNFPMPNYKVKRLQLINSYRLTTTNGESSAGSGSEFAMESPAAGGEAVAAAAGPSAPTSAAASSSDFQVDPPAGINFQNLQPDFVGACGYQVLHSGLNNSRLGPTPSSSSTSGGSSRKMRSFLKNRFSSQHHNSLHWAHVKAGLAERKLRSAALTNNTEGLKKLLDNHVNPNGTDEHQRTALHFAATKGYTDIIALLLENGAKPNMKDSLGNTPLHLAACTNHVGVVTLLLKAGTDLTELDNNGRTPMQLAQSKLKLLQRSGGSGRARRLVPTDAGGSASGAAADGGHPVNEVKTEVAQVIEMMRAYLSKAGHGTNSTYNDILNSFSQRLNLHQTQADINTDLQSLLDTLGNLKV